MHDEDERAYSVGYGRPPEATRFKPGNSGNPTGRPRGSKNSATLLNKALDEKVVIKEGGRQRKITKREAAFKQLANKAAAGDQRAIQMLLNELRTMQSETHPDSSRSNTLEQNEQEIMNEFVKRIREGGNDDGSVDLK